MNARHMRPAVATPRPSVAPVHRGPGAMSHVAGGPAVHHAPNAALLIDFDNVTMGIRSDLQTELRNLLSSDIVKGKVAVQRAYADWRRYPQYIVPLSESSIDLIFAPAYGSSKKNATDIRLAIDALELVFTRPEIGTFILLSGDSDFSSLVIKLKEYGKYVIGVGIRESSSDLLVQNCDEYYSYNALAGLVRAGDDEAVPQDPWELVVEAVGRMQRNGDVMRSDRLKQVMQDLDPAFDEKDLGYSKFSRFTTDAAQRGLLTVNRLENGQLEVGPAAGATPIPAAPATPSAAAAAQAAAAPRDEEADERRRRRGRRGRQRDGREGGAREPRVDRAPAAAGQSDREPAVELEREEVPREAASAAPAAPAAAPATDVVIGRTGERLTRAEAFDLVRRSVESLVTGDDAASARDVRVRAFELLGRDSESLSERNFPRILKDAHDGDVIDLRRRGDDYEVALAVSAAPITEQLNQAAAAVAAAAAPVSTGAPLPRGMGHRGVRGRGAVSAPPPDLLMIGVVEPSGRAAPPASSAPGASMPVTPAEPVAERAVADRESAAEVPSTGPRKRGRRPAKKAAGGTAGTARAAAAEAPAERPPAKTAAKRAGKSPAKSAAKSAAKAPAKRAPARSGGRKGAVTPAEKEGDDGAAPRKSGGRGRKAATSRDS